MAGDVSGGPYVLWFRDCGTSCLPLVGGKNAGLGEMSRAGLRVPPGFAVTTHAYRDFLGEAGLGPRIARVVDGLDGADVTATEQASAEIRRMVNAAPVPARIEDAIAEAYEALCAGSRVPDLPVAVRSSATAEDLPDASFAGQQDTFLWVRSAASVVAHTVRCWSSLYTARAMSYREQVGLRGGPLLISVGVQKMANARTAGVMFTLNPSNGDRSKIAIDASWGLGESVASGAVTPDNYLVDKVSFDIIRRTASAKLIEHVPDPATGGVAIRDVDDARRSSLCLSDAEVIRLAELGKSIERYYGAPQDIEWAIDGDLTFPDNVVLLQSRPETVWSQRPPVPIGRGAAGIESVLATLLAPLHRGGLELGWDQEQVGGEALMGRDPSRPADERS